MARSSIYIKSDISTEEMERELKQALIRFCKLAKKFGRELQPYREETWVKFRSLAPAIQSAVFEKFMTYHLLCEKAAGEGIDIADDRSLIWWAIRDFGLRPPSNLFDTIVQGDILEIYNSEGIQIFRNWAFFEFSGYSIGDIFVYTWDELYLRDKQIIADVTTKVEQLLTGQIKQAILSGVPSHRIIERFSPRRKVMELTMKYFSPLYKMDEVAAFTVTSNVVKLGEMHDVEPQNLEVHLLKSSSHLSVVN
jgi:PAS domain-containing protein